MGFPVFLIVGKIDLETPPGPNPGFVPKGFQKGFENVVVWERAVWCWTVLYSYFWVSF